MAVARRVGYYIVVPTAEGDRLITGFVGPTGFLRPGTGAKLRTHLTTPKGNENQLRGVVICLDAEETTHGWDISTSRHRAWKRQRWHRSNKSPAEVYESFFDGDADQALEEEPVEIDRT